MKTNTFYSNILFNIGKFVKFCLKMSDILISIMARRNVLLVEEHLGNKAGNTDKTCPSSKTPHWASVVRLHSKQVWFKITMCSLQLSNAWEKTIGFIIFHNIVYPWCATKSHSPLKDSSSKLIVCFHFKPIITSCPPQLVIIIFKIFNKEVFISF